MKQINQDNTTLRPSIGRIINLLRARRQPLMTLAEAKQGGTCRGQRYASLRFIPISSIKGTIQREHDFDRNFRPTQRHTMGRWERINRAAEQGVDLPPIKLVKYGDAYFVSDGHHRVSVARYRGGLYMDAEVTEVFSDSQP